MSNFTVAVKLLVVFGLLALLVGQMLGGPSPFDDLQDTLTQGVEFPQFNDPYSETIVRETAFAEQPSEFSTEGGAFDGGATAVGCTNTSLGLTDCLLTADGDGSYLRMPVFDYNPDTMLPGPYSHLKFNWSSQDFRDVPGPDIREVVMTIQCRTETVESSFAHFSLFFSTWNNSPDPQFQQSVFGACPKTRGYSTLIIRVSFPNGVPDCDLTCFPFFNNEHPEQGNLLLIATSPDSFNQGNPVARFSFLRLDIAIVTPEDVCVPSVDAWLPALDNIACSIINFGAAVWKGIQFVINGLSFVIVSLGVVLIFLGHVVFGLLIGIVDMATWFLTIDAPDIVKGIFGVFTVAAIAFPILTVAGLIRGTGP